MNLKPLLRCCALTYCISFSLQLTRAQQSTWQPSPGHTQVAIWPGTPPDGQSVAGPETLTVSSGKDGLIAGKTVVDVTNVTQPTITIYSPPAKNSDAAVVVFPGGGYLTLAMDLEGTEVCDWLTSKGITCVLRKYRVPNSGMHWDNACQCQLKPKAPTALQDAQRTLGLVRSHAEEWHIDPHKIGVMGFSAGGRLAADISTHFAQRLYPAVDAADKESCRPDFAVTLYPGHLWIDDKKFELNPDIRVTSETPPTFIVQAQDDPVDSVNHSLVYYLALRKAGVPVEMHLYVRGGHAFGLRRTGLPISGWPQLVEAWLGTIGMIPPGHN